MSRAGESDSAFPKRRHPAGYYADEADDSDSDDSITKVLIGTAVAGTLIALVLLAWFLYRRRSLQGTGKRHSAHTGKDR